MKQFTKKVIHYTVQHVQHVQYDIIHVRSKIGKQQNKASHKNTTNND